MVVAHMAHAAPQAHLPRCCIVMCGTQFGWAERQLGHLFAQKLPVPSAHVIGDADPFRDTVRAWPARLFPWSVV